MMLSGSTKASHLSMLFDIFPRIPYCHPGKWALSHNCISLHPPSILCVQRFVQFFTQLVSTPRPISRRMFAPIYMTSWSSYMGSRQWTTVSTSFVPLYFVCSYMVFATAGSLLIMMFRVFSSWSLISYNYPWIYYEVPFPMSFWIWAWVIT